MQIQDYNPIIKNIIQKVLGETCITIERMKIGIRNEVYQVETEKRKMIIRINEDKDAFKGTEKNIHLFQSLEIQVPDIIFSDYSQKEVPFNYQILTYIEGSDLGGVIESLSDTELKNIAGEVVNIFKKLAAIPTNGKFGWIENDENSLVDSWSEIMKADKIKERNAITGVVGEDLMKKEQALHEEYKSYFDTVKSVLYYDDITSKNIIIKNGQFSGLVDLDCLMCGDPLETVGAIKASWYGTKFGSTYTQYIEDGLGLLDEQRKMVTVYAIMNRILWLSENGIQFNQNTTPEIDWGKVEVSKKIINDMFQELEK